MTVPVSLGELPQRAAAFGTSAYVITSAGTSSPRVTHVEVAFVAAAATGSSAAASCSIRTALGKSACREIVGNRHVTVLWPAVATTNVDDDDDDDDDGSDDDGPLSLIVDGCVEEIPPEGSGGEVRIVPRSAILHRRRTMTITS